MSRKTVRKNSKSTIVYFKIVSALTILTFLKCECSVQCCPEEKITQIVVHTSVKNSSCISSCKMIEPYLSLNGNRIDFSSSSDGCQWLNTTFSRSRYSDSLFAFGIDINDTNLILLDSLFLKLGTTRTFDVSVNGIGSDTIMTAVKTVYLSCINTMDTVLVFDNESECNECSN